MKREIVLIAAGGLALGNVSGTKSARNRAQIPSQAIVQLRSDTNCANVALQIPAISHLTEQYEKLSGRPDVRTGIFDIKGEFETTLAYRERIDKLWLGPLAHGHIIAFFHKLLPLSSSYDADGEILTINEIVSPDIDHRDENGKKSFFETPILYSLSSHDYRGVTAFGVARNVWHISGTSLSAIYPEPIASGDLKKGIVGYNLSFHATPVEARKIEETGGILMLGMPNKPFVFSKTVHDRPTLDDPTERSVEEIGLSIKLKCLTVIAGKKVYASFDAGENN